MAYECMWVMVGSSQHSIYILYSTEYIFKDNHFYFLLSLIAIQYCIGYTCTI